MTLNEKLYYQLYQFFDNDEARQRAANEIERWVIQEKINLLQSVNTIEDAVEIEDQLTQRLNELNDISK